MSRYQSSIPSWIESSDRGYLRSCFAVTPPSPIVSCRAGQSAFWKACMHYTSDLHDEMWSSLCANPGPTNDAVVLRGASFMTLKR